MASAAQFPLLSFTYHRGRVEIIEEIVSFEKNILMGVCRPSLGIFV